VADDLRALLAHDLGAVVEDGRVAATGAGWAARLGRDPTGEPAAALVAPGSAEALAAALAGGTADVEVGTAWLRVTGTPRGAGAVLHAADVTDLRDRDRAARRAEALLRDVGSTLARVRHRLGEAQALAHVGSFELDTAAHTLTWSPALYELLGVPPDHDLSDPAALMKQIHPDDQDRVRSWFWSAPPEGERRELEMRFVRTDGAMRHARASLTTDRGADGRTLICGSARDVTEAFEAEAALAAARAELSRALAEHRRFAATLSHELRTPAAGVIGLIDLASAAAPGEVARDLAQAAAAARHLLAAIDDVLVYARLAAGLVELTTRDFDLGDVIAEAVAVVAATARTKGVAVDAWVAPELARWRKSDPQRVRQLLVHLLASAVELTDSGGVALSARPGETPHQVVVRIDATGAGISRDRLAGTLGVAIARELIAQMNGRLHLTATPVGSHFALSLDLPAGVPGPPPPSPRRRAYGSTAPPAPLEVSPAVRVRVLIADDTPMIRDVVARLLVDHGHDATVVGDGDAAVEAAGRERFDLVLMDLSMPGTDGLAATRRIRADERARGRARVPIVALTAWPDDEARALAAGIDDYLVKPVDAGRLAALCDSVAAGELPPPIDRAALVERVGGNPKLAADVAALFVAKHDELAAGVRDAIARGDAAAIARAAHGARGALAMVAALPAMRAAAELEAQASDGRERGALSARLVREIARAAADLALP
jgi:PAS domain S-box-containing protein